MPIFHLNQPACLFAHIPKTAGNSIRNVVFNGDYRGPWFGEKLPDEWSDLFSFAFVRNPFDRLVSAWKMFTEGTQDTAWTLPEGKSLDMTLEQVLELGLDPGQPFGHPRYNLVEPTALTRLKNHILPQTHPYHGIQFVKFVGRFENLNSDFTEVARRLGLASTTLPKTNWTRERQGYRDFFSRRTKALAEKFYQEDLERFQYRF